MVHLDLIDQTALLMARVPAIAYRDWATRWGGRTAPVPSLPRH